MRISRAATVLGYLTTQRAENGARIVGIEIKSCQVIPIEAEAQHRVRLFLTAFDGSQLAS